MPFHLSAVPSQARKDNPPRLVQVMLRESKHQPRLIGYPIRVERRHLLEQVLIGRRGFIVPPALPFDWRYAPASSKRSPPRGAPHPSDYARHKAGSLLDDGIGKYFGIGQTNSRDLSCIALPGSP